MSFLISRRGTNIGACAALVTMLVVLVSCGGGGNGMPVVPGASMSIVDTTLPTALSGDTVDYELPLDGGCGGPYVLALIDGELPPGIELDDIGGRHNVCGTFLEAGECTFRIQVTDTGCDPFVTTTAEFTWDVGIGELRIVGARPGLIPHAAYDDVQKWPDADAIPQTVYSTFTAIDFVIAGGVPPYVCYTVDDPDEPNDRGLPLGTTMPADGASIVGSPVEVGAGGRPFLFTMEAKDAAGNTTRRRVQWKVATPPIIITNEKLADGQAGQVYSDLVQLADGVPPFAYELIDDLPTVLDEDITYDPPAAPTFPSGTGFTVTTSGPADNKIGAGGGSTLTYPATTDDGPSYAPFPSEGIFLVDDGTAPGGFAGLPRRVGDFTVYVHVYSTLVPNERGQHAFKPLPFNIAPSDPPAVGGDAFGVNPSFTEEGALLPGPEYATLPEFEVGVTYNPDPITHPTPGLQLLAQGGVPQDGYKDQPHRSQRERDWDEVEGRYWWTSDWDPATAGVQPPPTGIAMDLATNPSYSNGLLETTNPSALNRSLREYVSLTVRDFQLPDSARNVKTETFGYSVGPDVVIITHSNASLTQYRNSYSTSQRHAWNDNDLTIQRFEPLATTPRRVVLDDSDMAATHVIPTAAGLGSATNPLGALLSGATGGDPTLDLLRCTINATGWWDDLHHLNARGARPFQHADANRGYQYYAGYGSSYYNNGNWQPSCSAIALPDAEGVTHAADLGRYADGGRLYHFDSANRFGVFIVRNDAKIYVPFAYEKDSSIAGFGDGIFQSYSTVDQNSALRTVQMTVSPDGRFAAMKLKRYASEFYEHANTAQIVIFSLTGEKPFAGGTRTWKIIDGGAAATGSGHRILHASSLALTNTHLYFTMGSYAPSSHSYSSSPMYYQSWSGHYLMCYEIQGSDPAAKLIKADDPTDTEWKLDVNVPMQTTFHHHGPDYYSSLPIESYTFYGYWPYHRYWREDGMNLNEHGQAPTPFRVSRDGKAVAFMAGENVYSTYNANVYMNHGWVDYEGSGARRITSKKRHHVLGSGRGYSLMTGPNEYGMWGRYNGPTPGLEISDDGLQVAFTYFDTTKTVSTTTYAYYSSHPWANVRENIILCRTTSAAKWTNRATVTTERDVTSKTFGGSHYWKFGGLAFSVNGNRLVFWGGAPVYRSTSTSYAQSYHFHGTYYVHNVTDTDRVTSMLAATAGGSPDGAGKLYTATTPNSPTATSGMDNRFGAIQPCGGFMSRNRKYLYVTNAGATSSADGTACKLIGLNLAEAVDNGHAADRGFVPSGWPSRRGFVGNYYYYPRYWLADGYGYAPNKIQGAGRQVMAKDTGWVFWGSGYQYSGPSSSGSSGGPPHRTYYRGAYGYGGVGLYGFNADVGGAVKQLNAPGLSQDSTGTYELLHWIEVTPDGKRLAYVSSYYYLYSYYNRERVNYVENIDFATPNGAIHADFDAGDDAGRLEASNGRAGEAMAFTPHGPTLYYAYKVGASNETGREMVKRKYDPATGTWATTRFPAVTGRINVLYAAR